MNLTLFSIFGLFVFITCLILAIFVTIFGKTKLSRIWALFNLVTAIWGLGVFFVGNLNSSIESSLFWWKFAHLGGMLIPVTFLHTMMELTSIRKTKILIFFYLQAIFFISLTFTGKIGWKLVKMFDGFYYVTPLGFPYILASIFWFLSMFYGFVIFMVAFRKTYGIKKNQFKYLFFGLSIGFIGGASHFFPVYGIKIQPFNVLIIFYPLIATYAILRYRLMDIKVALTRTTIFVAVYTLVLGLPFIIATWAKVWLIQALGARWWTIPLGLMAVLATVGPFIYIYLDRKAEERLLKEQRRYQDTLKQASVGMTRIRNLQKLLSLITHIVTKTVHISYAAIYLHHHETDEYILQVSRDKGRVPIFKVTPDNPVITWLSSYREPLIHEEIKLKAEESNDPAIKQLEESMRVLTASVIIPSFLENKFMGFFVLGDKISRQIYTVDDLNVFRVLASQAALAIENAQFYEEAKEMQEQIAQAEKMATIGTMADGLSHQINNRFHALSLIAGDTIDTIKLTDTASCSPEVKDMVSRINYALGRIQANVMQGGEVVKGLLKYTRKNDEAMDSLTLDEILDNTLEMVQYKVRLSEIDFIRDYSSDIPNIRGNLVQLLEVFFNFIDNAYEAILERKAFVGDGKYRGKITVSARPKNNRLEVIVEDNGMGVKEENLKKIFTPFFTTKTSSRKGTGLGLYVIKRIIDTHSGSISFESKYNVGTRFILELPTAH